MDVFFYMRASVITERNHKFKHLLYKFCKSVSWILKTGIPFDFVQLFTCIPHHVSSPCSPFLVIKLGTRP